MGNNEENHSDKGTIKCPSSICCEEVGDTSLAIRHTGDTLLTGLKGNQETTKKIVKIKEQLNAARSHQKSYVDTRRRPLEFKIRGRVQLKVVV